MAEPRALILGCAGPQLAPAERDFFRDADPWGFILFARNVEAPDQLRALVGDLRAAVGRRAPVLIDQEGGRVARLGPPHWRRWPPAAEEGAGLGLEARAARIRLRYRLIAAELAALGIDVNCVPVADVARPHTHPILRDRCFGSDAAIVARLARAAAEGTLAGGVLPVVKHVPGHGAARADSHAELPVVDLPRETLEAVDFVPFRALADAPLAMTAHVLYPALDPERPATLSPAVIGLIREEVGLSGALMSDDISMGALAGPLAARARAALAAGCDLVLHCNGDAAEMAALAAAVPRLSGEPARRARAALEAGERARRQAAEIDIAALIEEYEALGRG